jgi:hypothetical protein
MSGNDPAGNGNQWYVEARILSASEERGIFQVEKVHPSFEEAEQSLGERADKHGIAVFPEACSVRPEEGNYLSFPLGKWDSMDRALEQVQQHLRTLDELKIPNPKL